MTTYEETDLAVREKQDLVTQVASLQEQVKKWRNIAKTLRDGGAVAAGDLADLETAATNARRDELKRIKVILKMWVDKVNAADPALPLEPQLGFDPTKIA